MNNGRARSASDPPTHFTWARHLPVTSGRRIALRIDPAGERAIRSGHPWLYEASVRRQSEPGRPGDLAVIFDRKDRFLAIGLLDPTSVIRTRILHCGKPQTIDDRWYRSKLAAAIQRRATIALSGTDGYRLIHGENDGLPGLVIDRYANSLVVKLYSVAWIPHLVTILDALLNVQPAERIYLRLARVVQKEPDYLGKLGDGTLLWGAEPGKTLIFQENNLLFEVDPVHGQKTGFFLDQRDNRQRVRALANGQEVLNVFAYTGGFSVYAAAGGARRVTSVDISHPALDAACRNFTLNGKIEGIAAAEHEIMAVDAFEALRLLRRQGRHFDMVILDPPAFAKNRREVPDALAAYGRLTDLALALLRQGGRLVQASCSSQIGTTAFEEAIRKAALRAQRPLRDVRLTGHAIDHPIGFHEGAYLNCLYAQA